MTEAKDPFNEGRKIKCRFCSFQTVPWSTSGQGRKHSGMTRLRHHIRVHHPERFKEIYPDWEEYEDRYGEL